MMAVLLRATAIVLALALAGCGFRPIYGSFGEAPHATEIFKRIYVAPIPDSTGYELRNRLIDLLDGTSLANQALYRLSITMTQGRRAVVLQNDSSISRYNFVTGADYVLTDMATNKLIAKGHESTLTSYNVVTSPYATLTAQQDAQRQAADDLASRIHMSLGVFLARQKRGAR